MPSRNGRSRNTSKVTLTVAPDASVLLSHKGNLIAVPLDELVGLLQKAGCRVRLDAPPSVSSKFIDMTDPRIVAQNAAETVVLEEGIGESGLPTRRLHHKTLEAFIKKFNATP